LRPYLGSDRDGKGLKAPCVKIYVGAGLRVGPDFVAPRERGVVGPRPLRNPGVNAEASVHVGAGLRVGPF